MSGADSMFYKQFSLLSVQEMLMIYQIFITEEKQEIFTSVLGTYRHSQSAVTSSSILSYLPYQFYSNTGIFLSLPWKLQMYGS
jgi:hypothetical protein